MKGLTAPSQMCRICLRQNKAECRVVKESGLHLLSTRVACGKCPKISGTPVSNTPNSVCNSWISMKCRTLHYLDISYGHTHCDICTLLCMLSVTSLLCQSLFALRHVQCTRLRLRACIEAKGGHFKLKLYLTTC